MFRNDIRTFNAFASTHRRTKVQLQNSIVNVVDAKYNDDLPRTNSLDPPRQINLRGQRRSSFHENVQFVRSFAALTLIAVQALVPRDSSLGGARTVLDCMRVEGLRKLAFSAEVCKRITSTSCLATAHEASPQSLPSLVPRLGQQHDELCFSTARRCSDGVSICLEWRAAPAHQPPRYAPAARFNHCYGNSRATGEVRLQLVDRSEPHGQPNA